MSDITLSGKVTTDNPIGKQSPKPATRGGAKKQTEADRLLKLFEKDVPSILAKLDPTRNNQIQLANSILLVDEIKKWKEANNYDGTISSLLSNKRKNEGLVSQVWDKVDSSIEKGTSNSFIVPSFVPKLQRNFPEAVPVAEAVPMGQPMGETPATEIKTMVAEQQSLLDQPLKGKVETEVERIEREKRERNEVERQVSQEMGRMKMTGELDKEIDERLSSGINPDTTTDEIAEEISTAQEGGQASINEPELQTPQYDDLQTPRPQGDTQAEAEAEAEAQPQNVTTEISKQATAEDRINIGQQVDDIPKETKLSKIDESRFSTQFKTIAQLNEDIKYFISNFGNVLGKTVIEENKKINKQNLAQVRR